MNGEEWRSSHAQRTAVCAVLGPLRAPGRQVERPEALREQSRCTSNLEVICFEAYANAMKQRLYRFEPCANVMKDMSKHPLYIESFF